MDRYGNADGNSAKERARARRQAKRQSMERHADREDKDTTYRKNVRPRGLHRREILHRLIRERGDRCGICKKKLGDLNLCDVDHIVPRSRGGTGAWSNLQPAHVKCNQTKANRLQHEIDGR